MNKIAIMLCILASISFSFTTSEITAPNGKKSKKGKGTNIYDKDISFKKIMKRYKGQVIYVDMWASWCAPCIQQMSYSAKLHKKFKKKDVAFVYISIDEKKRAWKKAIKKNKIKGEHYRMDKKQAKKFLKEVPDFNQIPRYLVIDKKGNIREYNAPRPQSPRAAKIIKKWLKKKGRK